MASRHLMGAALAIVIAGCAAKPAEPPTQQVAPITVDAAKATVVDRRRSEAFPATVRADRAAIVCARVAGVLARLDASPGQKVSEGEILGELQADELRARRDQARALATQAAADLARARQLVGQHVVTQADLDVAQSRADASASALTEAETLLGYVRVAAPFTGVVVRRHRDPGATIAAGTPLVEIEDAATLRIEVEVPESLAGAIAVGSPGAVELEGSSSTASCAVVERSPVADPATRSVLIKLAPPTSLAPHSGQFGRVRFGGGPSPALQIPASAVVHRGQVDAVVVIGDGVAHLRLVRLGEVAADGAVVRSGLAEGELVVTGAPAAIPDGARVVVR